jgi:hypothetical protein
MTRATDPEHWQPDVGLVFTVRTRRIAISDLCGPDRAWLVAALTVQNWTVSSIADRLSCSVRLVQQIKTEPMYRACLYALEMERAVQEQKGLRRMEALVHAQDLASRDVVIARLTRQRDLLLDRYTPPRKESA